MKPTQRYKYSDVTSKKLESASNVIFLGDVQLFYCIPIIFTCFYILTPKSYHILISWKNYLKSKVIDFQIWGRWIHSGLFFINIWSQGKIKNINSTNNNFQKSILWGNVCFTKFRIIWHFLAQNFLKTLEKKEK